MLKDIIIATKAKCFSAAHGTQSYKKIQKSAFVIMFLVFLFPCVVASAAEQPNIIFIMADDHASHALSAYFRDDVVDKMGAERSQINETPKLDALASEGMIFTNAFCTNSICGPARATLLTGKYSHKNGYKYNDRIFNTSQQTFPKLLKQAGYQTAIIGKLHLLSDATKMGFDVAKTLFWQGTYFDPSIGGKTIEGYTTDVITDEAIDWILNGRNPSKPFYLSIHHKAPHRNWEVDDAHKDMYVDETLPLPVTFNDDYSTRSRAAEMAEMKIEEFMSEWDYKEPIPLGLTPQEEKEWIQQAWLKEYLRTIASIDDNVGHLLEVLDNTGLANNTIVIYTSDQGFFLGDHGWFDKRFMYEESLRYPLIVRFPGTIAESTVSEYMVLNVDFAPTFLDYAGIAIPSDMQGRSIRPLLEGTPPPDWRTSMYYRYYDDAGAPLSSNVQQHYGVRNERYKLIYYNTLNEWELFDLQEDPYELLNVYDDPAYATVVSELKDEIERLQTELKDDGSPWWWGCTPAQASLGQQSSKAVLSGIFEVLIVMIIPFSLITFIRIRRRLKSK